MRTPEDLIEDLRGGDEWSPNGQVNYHELGDALEQFLPLLREFFGPFPGGWAPLPQQALRLNIDNIIHLLQQEDDEPRLPCSCGGRDC